MKKNKIHIATWNVNGIRAAYPKGLKDFLTKVSPDIVCLQETKISEDLVEFFQEELKSLGFIAHFSCAKKKGYSGVALLFKQKYSPIKIQMDIMPSKFDDEGRTILAEFPDFNLFSCYFPNGQRDHNRVPYKMEYCEQIAKMSLELSKSKCTMVAGDINIAHCEIDLRNPKQNQNTTGFLPVEREFLDSYFERGFSDIFRKQHLGLDGAYTWWTYRGDCRQKNVGWRIDAIYIDQKSEHFVKESFHSPEIKGSDHCPTNIYFELP